MPNRGALWTGQKEDLTPPLSLCLGLFKSEISEECGNHMVPSPQPSAAGWRGGWPRRRWLAAAGMLLQRARVRSTVHDG